MKTPERDVFDNPQNHQPDEAAKGAINGFIRCRDDDVKTERQGQNQGRQQYGEQHARKHASKNQGWQWQVKKEIARIARGDFAVAGVCDLTSGNRVVTYSTQELALPWTKALHSSYAANRQFDRYRAGLLSQLTARCSAMEIG